MRIDVHTHIHPDPIAKPVLDKYRNIWLSCCWIKTVAGIKQHMIIRVLINQWSLGWLRK
ncbi:MAG: hypothetical protein Ct9H300mP27_10950 [Chloroflexota bacterium]|nr:MAG: hypothetical protein Ct9H300mP27_10950 [Chloroflexota bacterium]